jgi:protein involved in polysaccharide export with SLBB domain
MLLEEQASVAAQSSAPNAQFADASGQSALPPVDTMQDTARLDALYRSRTRDTTVADYPIGPGDVVEVSVPPIDELRERTVRVEADGSISLPMVGGLQGGGLTEKQLRVELSERLKTYMYKPEVDVFVKEYRSRQVAVVGMVNSPGLITLTSPNQTVLDMMTRAGGLTATAADEIILMPAEENKQQVIGRIAEVSANGADPAVALHNGRSPSAAATAREAAFKRGELGALLRQNSHPLIIGLKSTALTWGRHLSEHAGTSRRRYRGSGRRRRHGDRMGSEPKTFPGRCGTDCVRGDRRSGRPDVCGQQIRRSSDPHSQGRFQAGARNRPGQGPGRAPG